MPALASECQKKLLHERGIEENYDTVRYWWDRFAPMFAAGIKRKRVQQLRAFSKWKWHVDEVFVRAYGKRHYFGKLLITRMRCWKLMSPNAQTKLQH
jgi:transposase-like protein